MRATDHIDMAAASHHEQAPAARGEHSFSCTHIPSFGSSSFSTDHAVPAASAPPVEALLWPHSPSPWHLQPSASVTGFAIAQSLQTAASIQPDFDGRSVRVENLHVHFHNQYAVGGIREEYEKHLRTDSHINSWPGAVAPGNHPSDCDSRESCEPSFALASSAEGINFGRKFVKGFYRAVKHVDERRHLITYTQSPSTAQSLLLAMSLGLSTKRAKHAIFVFDSGPPQHLAHAWPLHIHLREIASLIQSLGATFEYTRAKVKKNQFSLYIFGIKQRGTRFSSKGMQTWAAMSYWAHNLPDSADNGMLSSFLSSLGSSQGTSF